MARHPTTFEAQAPAANPSNVNGALTRATALAAEQQNQHHMYSAAQVAHKQRLAEQENVNQLQQQQQHHQYMTEQQYLNE